ncbi:MAG: hypothetical protein GY945_09210, partial [Rhodobacteraceae bacterium]|nr:hypothetical protein [Paracoccaceae bacterium]
MAKRYKQFGDYRPPWRERRRTGVSNDKNGGEAGDDTAARIARINELSKTARATWLSLLGYLAFVGVTLLGVEDADFFLPSRQTQLPLINVAIPTREFFIFAPLLGTALYAYLHFHLMKLWHALRVPPASIAGTPLSDHITPWLINDMGLMLRFDAAARNHGLRLLSVLVTFVLVFLAGPAVIGGFWWRYWPAHEWQNTLVIGLAFVVSVYVTFASLNAAAFRLKALPIIGYTGQNFTQMAALICVVTFVGWMKTEGLQKTEGSDPTVFTLAGYQVGPWLVALAIPPVDEDDDPI